MSYRVEVKSYGEGIEALSGFEFPVIIRDTTGHTPHDEHYPDVCSGQITACGKLNWIFDHHEDERIIVEIIGTPKIMTEVIKQNRDQPNTTSGA